MKIKEKVLLIEDERTIRGFMQAILTANGYDVLMAGTGAMANTMISSHCPDLIILDLGLPDMDGMTILRSVREWSKVPILVVSARSHERDKVEALDAGADDYLTKPFGTEELLARIRAAIRHTRTPDGAAAVANAGVFTAADLTIDYGKHRVYIAGRDAGLTQRPQRQPDPPRQHGQHPPQDRKKPRPARLHLHRIRRRLPHDRGRLKPQAAPPGPPVIFFDIPEKNHKSCEPIAFSPQMCYNGSYTMAHIP